MHGTAGMGETCLVPVLGGFGVAELDFPRRWRGSSWVWGSASTITSALNKQLHLCSQPSRILEGWDADAVCPSTSSPVRVSGFHGWRAQPGTKCSTQWGCRNRASPPDLCRTAGRGTCCELPSQEPCTEQDPTVPDLNRYPESKKAPKTHVSVPLYLRTALLPVFQFSLLTSVRALHS